MSNKSFLLELSEARHQTSNVDYRALLGQLSDSLRFAIKALADNPTAERMIELNCAWAVAAAALKNLPSEGAPAPVGGSPEPTKFAMAS